ncbi:MAG TPA: tryptophan 2,3-dioxygenase family protein [Anaerolineales bacterium]|nr:tryptophan 2,3-dioxygenase family protein [Anaerolineales bacterium]
MTSPRLNYSQYLQVDTILSAQQPRSVGPEHDELLFIIIHQVYELWFKQMLHEMDYLQKSLVNGDAARAVGTLRRILTILKTVVHQIDVLETMTPLEFLSFRDFLESGSGFQSAQFREVEFALGYKRLPMLKHFESETDEYQRLLARYQAPSLWDSFLAFLAKSGVTGLQNALQRDVTQPVTSNPAVQEALVDVYRNRPELMRVCESLVDLDEGLQEWRYRHVKMVARTIGDKQGTGGSSGVGYLASTIRPLFPDLWEIRTHL